LVKPPEDISSPLSLQERVDRAITDKINAKTTTETRSLKDISSVVKKELMKFEIEGKQGPNLEKDYNDLNTIPPTTCKQLKSFSPHF
jgi:hypothetical protein